MRVAYVLARDFEVRVERLRRPELSGRPVVLGGTARDRAPVRAASADARRLGVRGGMQLREAAMRCPSAAFLAYDEGCYAEAAERPLAALERYSDAVEPDGHGRGYLDAAGWGGIRSRLELARQLAREPELAPYGVSVGLAPSKFTARLAALRAQPGAASAVGAWMEECFLEDFPVERLPLGERNLHRLRRFGVRTIGEYAALPADEIKLQFGAEGQAAYRLALGEDPRPVVPRAKPDEPTAYRTFDPALEDGEVLRGVLARLAEELCGRLGGGAAGGVVVRLVMADGERRAATGRLPEPSAAERDVLLAAAGALGRLEVASGVERLEVRLLGGALAVGGQLSLWNVGRREERSNALARLRERFGATTLRVVVPGELRSLLPHRQFALAEGWA